MISQALVNDINSLSESEQSKVIRLVQFIKKNRNGSAASWLDGVRKKYADVKPMTMDEIDRIIHE